MAPTTELDDPLSAFMLEHDPVEQRVYVLTPASSQTHHHHNQVPAAKRLSRVEKRALNTQAARRYRQKRRDQVSGLEAELDQTRQERDAFKVRVAELEGELKALKHLLQVPRS